MKKRVIILMCLLGCLATGCGNKEASSTKTFTASNTDRDVDITVMFADFLNFNSFCNKVI